MEKLDRVRIQQADYDMQAQRLREQIPAVRQRDQQALGRALAAGEPEPELEVPRIEQEIERAARNARLRASTQRPLSLGSCRSALQASKHASPAEVRELAPTTGIAQRGRPWVRVGEAENLEGRTLQRRSFRYLTTD